MTIDLVHERDCVIGSGKGKVDCSSKNIGGRRHTVFKRIDNRDRKKCHKCGHDGGLWHEFFVKGKREYLFLCQSCIDIIENVK